MSTPRRRARPAPDPDTEENDVTLLDARPEVIEHGSQGSREDGVAASSRIPALRPLSPVPTYVGIAVAAVGFVLIAVAWGKTAGQVNVALQVPYLISGGLTGLALVMVGVTVISVAARRRDAALREQQTALLADALRELSAALDPDSRR
jgi:hypothetical protein